MKNSKIIKGIIITLLIFFLVATVQPYVAENEQEKTTMQKLLASNGV